MNSVVVVETALQFADFMEHVSSTSHVAIDTESNSFYAYSERICLVQVSTTARDYILDPLALKDLGALGKILEDPKIEKIFHAASNDVMGLKRDYQFQVRNLFDTAIACKLLGYKQLGLARILEQHFGVILDKKWQRYDWGKRPLHAEQLNYASLDTHFLIPLRHSLTNDLSTQELWEKAQEAFAKAAQQELQERAFHPEAFLQIRGAQTLDPAGKRILKALYVYRDREAKRRDRAPFRVLTDETLVRLAQERPQAVTDFSRVKGMPRSYQEGRTAFSLLGLIRKAISPGTESPLLQ
jgi:ribonuclease D